MPPENPVSSKRKQLRALYEQQRRARKKNSVTLTNHVNPIETASGSNILSYPVTITTALDISSTSTAYQDTGYESAILSPHSPCIEPSLPPDVHDIAPLPDLNLLPPYQDDHPTERPFVSNTTLTCSIPDPNIASELTEPDIFIRLLRAPNICPKCNAKKFAYDGKAFCCLNGAVVLPNLPIPEKLYWLYTSSDNIPRSFRKAIRMYNSTFAFTSFGIMPRQNPELPKGSYCFRLQGQVYHRIDHLFPENNVPAFLQLYIYDTEHETSNRLLHFGRLLEEAIIIILEDIMYKYNPFAKTLKSLRELPSFPEYSLAINEHVHVNQAVYNCPTASQVAAIWIDSPNRTNQDRLIVLRPRTGPCQWISANAGCYDSLQYPLLFPRGEVGWENNIEKTIRTSTGASKHVTAREYYCYKLQIRSLDPSILLYAGRLLHQYLVDMYVKIETSRLNYFYMTQQSIRTEILSGLQDSYARGETDGANVGRIILPSSFTGSCRDIATRYRDAMAIVRNYGKPDLFITMTCNPHWIEIQNELSLNQQASDRPDLCARIFYSKLRDLMFILFREKLLGSIAAYAIVVEFQKRGLPHAHLLLIFTNECKPRNPNDYDKLVSAEIPDKTIYPILHQRVINHMIHGPCNGTTTYPCMATGQCKFHYPRQLSSATFHGSDSFVLYRRRNNQTFVNKHGVCIDNRWVVPYNPTLLLMFNCHLNVEICSSIKSVKYLYKYIYKGHDRVQVSIGEKISVESPDEIKNYQNARWISAIESAWRIFGYELFFIFPSVYHLPIHLPNQQPIFYRGYRPLGTILDTSTIEKSMLTEFFSMNSQAENGLNLLYRDFPAYFVWNKAHKSWTHRKKDVVIGRTYAISPKEGEKYYLQLLLNHIRGPTSFANLLLVDGFLCKDFKESCIHRGLLEDDRAIEQCLIEAATYQMPSGLRALFATLLLFCSPVDVRALWTTFWLPMAEDYTRGSLLDDHHLQCKVLDSIDHYLRESDKTIADFDLPTIPIDFVDVSTLGSLFLDEVSIVTPPSDLLCIKNLNSEQQYAYNAIIHAITSASATCFFIDGPGGTGKTYLYRAILAHVRVIMNKLAIATASSGIAAINLPGGRTAHSRFKIPLILDEYSTCNITNQSSLANLLRHTDLIIWDEASMMTRFAFEALDRTMQDLTKNKTLFGGKVVVLGGDFRQILPIIPKGTRAQIVDACLVSSPLWPSLLRLKLTINMRALDDPSYANFVLRVGDGIESALLHDQIRLPDKLVIPATNNDAGKAMLINEIFTDLGCCSHNTAWITESVILASTNNHVDDLNRTILSKFPGPPVTYFSFDSVEDDHHNLYNEDFLHSLNPGGFPLHELILKVGCPIMLLRNLNPSKGLCNGTRLICRSFQKNLIVAEIITGQTNGNVALLPRIPMLPTDDASIPFVFKRKQFPIKLAFAMTINKSQGQTLHRPGIYLPEPVFTHGQLYVALSRGTSSAATKVYVQKTKLPGLQGTYTKNVVFHEVFV